MSGDNRLPVLAGEIADDHERAIKAGRAFVRHAVEAGRRLTEAKTMLPHGQWRDWLVANVPSLNERTAQRYMRAAKAAGKSDTVSFSSLRHLVRPIKREREQWHMIGVTRDGRTAFEVEPAATGYSWLTAMLPNGEVVGNRRPVRDDAEALAAILLTWGVNPADMEVYRCRQPLLGLREMLGIESKRRDLWRRLEAAENGPTTIAELKAFIAGAYSLQRDAAALAARLEALQ